jgi:hypothetical protein
VKCKRGTSTEEGAGARRGSRGSSSTWGSFTAFIYIYLLDTSRQGRSWIGFETALLAPNE